MNNYNSYADVLESYIIAEEGLFNFIKKPSKIVNYKATLNLINRLKSEGIGDNFQRVKNAYDSKDKNKFSSAEWNRKFNEAAIKDAYLFDLQQTYGENSEKVVIDDIARSNLKDCADYFDEKGISIYRV